MTEDLVARWTQSPWRERRTALLATDRLPLDPRNPRKDEPWGVDLRGIDLRGAVIANARLSAGDLTGAVLRDTAFISCYVDWIASAADADGMRFDNCHAFALFDRGLRARRLQARATDLTGAIIEDSDLREARFEETRLPSCHFLRCRLEGARFVRCDLHSAVFTGSTVDGAVFEDCVLDAADLRGVSMRGARLLRCTLHDANWSGADLTDADVKTSIFPARSTR